MGVRGLFVLLVFFYLGLSSNFEPLNVITSVIIAMIIIALLNPEWKTINIQKIPQMTFSLIRYIIWLIWDLIISGIQVAKLLVDPRLPIQPGLVSIPSRAKTDLGEALSAHAISLTPGELVVEIGEDGTLYTHCLDVSHAAEYLEDAQKMRKELLDKIFQ